jgi:hypothetical protein
MGDRFPVSIVVKNATEKKIVLGRANHGDDVGQIDYTIFAAYKSSPDAIVQPVAIQPEHQDREGRSGYVQGWLEPGGSFTDTLQVTDVLQFSRSGAYFLRLKRKVPDWIGKGEVVSNQIEIDVVE